MKRSVKIGVLATIVWELWVIGYFLVDISKPAGIPRAAVSANQYEAISRTNRAQLSDDNEYSHLFDDLIPQSKPHPDYFHRLYQGLLSYRRPLFELMLVVPLLGWGLLLLGTNPVSKNRSAAPPRSILKRSKKATFIFLRTVRGITGVVAGWMTLGVALAGIELLAGAEFARWPQAWAYLIVKIGFILILSALFYGIGKLIHFLHYRWHGTPHPALSQRIGL